MPSRRDFVKAAALATGHWLFVKPSQCLAAVETPPPTRQDIAPRIDELSPDRAQRGGMAAEPNMAKVELECDVLVAGGGLAGICAAIAAARNGSQVILVHDRSRLGGNASSEVRMHPMGSRFGFRESGIIEELSLENAFHNPHFAWELWDLALYDRCISEPRIKLILDSTLFKAEVHEGAIRAVWVRCDTTEHLYHIKARIFVDSTGDSRLALEAGAEYMVGREAIEVFNESNASYDKTGTTQGSSILFTSRKHDRPMSFHAPSWARRITAEDLQHRRVGPGNWEYGYWWIELGGTQDTIRDQEQLRFELLAVVLGVWDFIKNSGQYPDSANWALETVGMIPGRRESRRVTGEHIMTQADIEGKWKEFHDAVAFGGWAMDDHPAMGFDASGTKPYRPAKFSEPYNIPLGSLYSKNVKNLMMAGRNISATHVAFTSIRVMKTCAIIGQATGTAAAMCVRDRIVPRQLRNDKDRVRALQQCLLRDDQTIMQVRNEDPDDLARKATVTASASSMGTRPENLLTGTNWDPKGKTDNRWIAPMSAQPAWVRLEWQEPVRLSEVQLIHDTGIYRTLTMAAAANVQKEMVAGPQPETIRDYALVGILPDGTEKPLAEITQNYHRLRRDRFDPVVLKALRIDVRATNGGPEARLYEIRAYG